LLQLLLPLMHLVLLLEELLLLLQLCRFLFLR